MFAKPGFFKLPPTLKHTHTSAGKPAELFHYFYPTMCILQCVQTQHICVLSSSALTCSHCCAVQSKCGVLFQRYLSNSRCKWLPLPCRDAQEHNGSVLCLQWHSNSISWSTWQLLTQVPHKQPIHTAVDNAKPYIMLWMPFFTVISCILSLKTDMLQTN